MEAYFPAWPGYDEKGPARVDKLRRGPQRARRKTDSGALSSCQELLYSLCSNKHEEREQE